MCEILADGQATTSASRSLYTDQEGGGWEGRPPNRNCKCGGKWQTITVKPLFNGGKLSFSAGEVRCSREAVSGLKMRFLRLEDAVCD